MMLRRRLLRWAVSVTAAVALPVAAAGAQSVLVQVRLLGPRMFATGPDSQAVAAVRLEGASKPLDLVVANRDSRNVSVLRGAGDGTFTKLADYTVGNGPSAVVAADADGNVVDLDGNGIPDAAVANTSSGSVSLLLGTGGGAFAVQPQIAAGPSPSALAVGDFDENGTLDLAVANAPSSVTGTVTLLLGDGLGHFGPAPGSPFAVGVEPVGIAVGDFDGNHHLDLVTADQGGSDASLLLGNGRGGFAAAASVHVGTAPKAVAVGYLDQNDKADLVLVLRGSGKDQKSANEVAVLLGDGAGGFTAEPLVGKTSAHPTSVVLTDLNHDSKLDVVAGSGDSAQATILLGDGAGGFVPRPGSSSPIRLIAAGRDPYGVAAGDVNGDGSPDLVFADDEEQGVTVDLGNGDGTVDDAPVSKVVGQPVAVAVGDLDGDGTPDAATADYNKAKVGVLLAKPDGSFRNSTNYSVGKTPTDVAIADLVGDSSPDLAVASVASNQLWLLQGDGKGGFSSAGQLNVGSQPHAVAAADLTGDGRSDLVSADFGSDTVSVLINQGGAFPSRTAYAAGSQPLGLALADFTGDGYRDIAVTNYEPGLDAGTVTVLRNDGSSNPGHFDQAPQTYTVGRGPVALAAGDLNGDQRPDLVVANQGGSKPITDSSISVLIDDGHGGFTVEPPIALAGFTVGFGPAGVAISDLNHDGHSDLAIANAGTPNLSGICHVRTGPAGGLTILNGDGTGTFAAGPSYASLNDACDVAAVDLDGDGWDDLVVPAARSADVQTYGNLRRR